MKNLLTYFTVILLIASASIASEMTVKKIVIKGNVHTKEYIITRELLTRVGDHADDETLETDTNRLLNLGIFSEVWIDKVEDNGEYTIFVIVQERFAIVPVPILGYNEEDGWSVGGAVIHTNFNGKNRKAGVFGMFGGLTQYYATIYDPWMYGERVSLEVETYRSERDHPYENFHQVSRSAWFELGKKWDYKYTGRVKAGYLRVESDITGITMSADKYDDIPFLLFTGIYDSRDLWRNPSDGWLIHGKIGQYGVPGDAPDFRRFGVSFARFLPISFGRTIGINTQFWEKNGHVPVYESYYIGGSGSIRGLSGNSFSGTRLLISGIEYRFDIMKSRPIIPKFDFGIGGTLFIDNGTVWQAGETLTDQRFNNGFGFGLRFFLPIIEVWRIDLAWTEDTRYRVVFNVGSKF